MFRRTWVPVLLVACTTYLVILGGGVSGALGHSGPAGPHVPKEGGVVDMTLYSNIDGPRFSAVLTGAIGDFGKAVRTSSSGSADEEYNQLDVSVTRGAFRLDIAGVEGKLDASILGAFPTNTATCSGEIVVAGIAPIVSGSGTGAYKGIHGTFNMTITINEVERPPVCPKTDTSPFLAQSVFITASGVVAL